MNCINDLFSGNFVNLIVKKVALLCIILYNYEKLFDLFINLLFGIIIGGRKKS